LYEENVGYVPYNIHVYIGFKLRLSAISVVVVVVVVVNLSLCLTKQSRHEDALSWRCSSTHSLTSAIEEGEWSASRPGRFTPGERAPSTHC